MSVEADRRERQALDEAKDQLRKGWTPEEIVAVLEDAEKIIADLREVRCNFCDEPCRNPIQDPVAVSWLGSAATTWCSPACMEAEAEHRINAAGNR